jgi:hypothetical protein
MPPIRLLWYKGCEPCVLRNQSHSQNQAAKRRALRASYNGTCTSCFNRDASPGYKQCKQCRKRRRYYNRKYRAQGYGQKANARKKAVRASNPEKCSVCLVRDPSPGFKSCEQCRQYKRSMCRQYQSQKKELREANKNKCTNCLVSDPSSGYKTCQPCRQKLYRPMSRYWQSKKRAERKANNEDSMKCSNCLVRDPAPGFRTCQRCQGYSRASKRRLQMRSSSQDMCTTCHRVEASPGYQSCDRCRIRQNQRSRRSRKERIRRFILEGKCIACGETRDPGYSKCQTYREQDRAQWTSSIIRRPIDWEAQSRAARILLSPSTLYPLPPNIQRVLSAWYDKPYTIMVADFEYNVEAFRNFRHEAVWQVAIADASGNWIVPLTTINHCMSKQALFDRGQLLEESRRYENTIARFYGVVDEDETPGLTWEEIADLIDQHTKV